MNLKITQHDESTLILALQGRFDAFNAESVKECWLTNENIHFVIMDLSETTFIDSVALAVMVQGLKMTRSRGGNLILANPGEAARTIFELTAMERAFNIAPTVDDALDLMLIL